jgi:hypothetical protein
MMAAAVASLLLSYSYTLLLRCCCITGALSNADRAEAAHQRSDAANESGSESDVEEHALARHNTVPALAHAAVHL